MVRPRSKARLKNTRLCQCRTTNLLTTDGCGPRRGIWQARHDECTGMARKAGHSAADNRCTQWLHIKSKETFGRNQGYAGWRPAPKHASLPEKRDARVAHATQQTRHIKQGFTLRARPGNQPLAARMRSIRAVRATIHRRAVSPNAQDSGRRMASGHQRLPARRRRCAVSLANGRGLLLSFVTWIRFRYRFRNRLQYTDGALSCQASRGGSRRIGAERRN